MSENKVNNLLGVSMDKIKEMVDVNTVIGDPITAPDGTTVIPAAARALPFSLLLFWQSRTAMCAFCRLSRMFRLSIALWRVCRT